MELRHLRYFAAVADALSFRVAAESLNISTPALSKQIKGLEEEVGVLLLDRNTTQVRLTNAGAVFLTEAKLMLEHARRAVKQAREAEKGHRGRLIIGNVGPLTASYMANALTAFAVRYPDVELDMVDVDLPAQIEAMESDMIELGFVPAQEVPGLPSEYETAPVLRAQLGVAMPEDHPLAAKAALTLSELSGQRVLCAAGRASPSPHTQYVIALFSRRRLKPPRIVEVRGFESLIAMIAGGQGMSILAARRLTQVDNIRLRHLKDTGPDIHVDIHAIWRKGRRGVLARNFAEVFRSLHYHRDSANRKTR